MLCQRMLNTQMLYNFHNKELMGHCMGKNSCQEAILEKISLSNIKRKVFRLINIKQTPLLINFIINQYSNAAILMKRIIVFLIKETK